MNLEETKMMMQNNYDALLLDYAAGSLNEGQSLVVSAHLTLSPFARRIVRECESIGGAILDHDCAPVEMNAAALQNVLNRLDTKHDSSEDSNCDCYNLDGVQLPISVSRYLQNQDTVKWKTVYPGVHSITIQTNCRESKAQLLKIDPGHKVPEHTHEGSEITLMLDGTFEDELGIYSRGDLIVADEHVTHQPVSDAKMGCICLAVTDEPIKLTGWLGKIVNPFLTH